MLTPLAVQSEIAATWMRETAADVAGQADDLTQLDAAIGDGDHGINMNRGFAAVGKALAGQPDSLPPGRVLILAGKTLVSTVGGASGPLWGSFFRAAGRALGSEESVSAEALRAALAAGAGPARVLAAPGERGGGGLEQARAALAGARAGLEATAQRLRAGGRETEAEIVEAGALMAADPALDASVAARVAAGSGAAAALLEAAEDFAARIAAVPDERLAARAADVRSLGRRAARLAAGAPETAAVGAGCVLVADDLGPADVAELDAGVAGIALAAGGPTAHAAIVARSLGIPMAVGLGPPVLGRR